ncbi:MAG: putative baseplate assembly protein, partial [Pseudomonadota bacterium]|nr:putative baseplate assembly protein [Pseudomonadota bacterium]
ADFARTFAGISKASAIALTDGRRRVVHLSIAGADDMPIDINADLYRNLVAALRRFGDPQQALQVAARRLKILILHAGVRLQADYLWEAIEPKIRAALLATFGFDQRELGQSAYQSEAVSTIQQIDGVAWVDLRIFDAVPEGTSVGQLAGLAKSLTARPRIEAQGARIDSAATDFSKRLLAAELAMLTPAIPDTLILTEISR